MTADLGQFKSIAELEPKPNSWAETMEALIAGKFYYSEIEPLLHLAAGMADTAMRHALYPNKLCHVVPDRPWRKLIDEVILARGCHHSGEKFAPWVKRILRQLGKLVDEHNASKRDLTTY